MSRRPPRVVSRPPGALATAAGAAPGLGEVLAALAKSGLPIGEVYRKRGRTRHVELVGGDLHAAMAQESGWAVRAGDRHGSLFWAGSGEPPCVGWPAHDGLPIELPEPFAAVAYAEPADLDTPLLAEAEGTALLQSLATALPRELAGARLDRAVIEDGSSRSELASTTGVSAAWRARVATLFLEASYLPPRRSGSAARLSTRLYVAEREARRFGALGLLRRLADRLVVAASAISGNAGPGVEVAKANVVLDPAVAVVVLEGLLPLLVGSAAVPLRRAFGLGDHCAEALSVLDDGRRPGGVLAAPVDGEGTPTGRVMLIERGEWRPGLLDWREAREIGGVATGSVRRASWRDLPRRAASELFVVPNEEVSVAALVAEAGSGAYLLDALSSLELDRHSGRFALTACGFALEAGQVSAPLPRVVLHGRMTDLLNGVLAVGRDLTFYPRVAMLGSPSWLLRGVALGRSDRP